MSDRPLQWWTFLWHHANQTDKREVATLQEDSVKDMNFRVKEKKKHEYSENYYRSELFRNSMSHVRTSPQSEGHCCTSLWLPWRRMHNASCIFSWCSTFGITTWTHEVSCINSIRKGFCNLPGLWCKIFLCIRNKVVKKYTWGISSNSKEQNNLIHSNVTKFKNQS